MFKHHLVSNLIGICKQYLTILTGLINFHYRSSRYIRPTTDSSRYLRYLSTKLPYLPRS